MGRADSHLRQALALLRAAADHLEPDEASVAAPLFAACAKLAEAGTLRCAIALGDDGARRLGKKNQASLVSSLRGTSLAKAKQALAVTNDLGAAPVAAGAFFAGELSIDQAAAIAPVVRTSPTRAGTLVEAARQESLGGLRKQVERTQAELLGEEGLQEAHRALHARRYCRLYPVPGGMRIDALVGARDAALLRDALSRATKRLWKERADASIDQLRADALVALVTGGGTVSQVLVHVDAAALRRGAAHGAERCEIQGVGPVPVETARQLLGEGFFSVVVHDGADIATVTSTTRTVPRRVRTALVARDTCCVVPGCEVSDSLEIDHWRTDFKDHGRTELDNLCRLCSQHHRMKTRTGWRIVGGPGKWQWLPPRRCEARAGP